MNLHNEDSPVDGDTRIVRVTIEKLVCGFPHERSVREGG